MSVAESTNTYSIHHCRILGSSFKKLAWAKFQAATTETRSETLANWAIRPEVQLIVRANFVHSL